MLDVQGARFRSMLDSSNGTAGLFDGTESRSMGGLRSNASSNIYPYGNVPLSVLQQQLPADIKVGNNGSSKRPSFYQWPLVGASQAANFFFGGHGRPRFKSLGGRSRGGFYEPQGQLTPPSLQQLQQQGASASTSGKEGSSTRRHYFRRNNALQQMSQEESQSRQEYFLLRQQQLVLQQQQFNQAKRFRVFQQQQQQQNQAVVTPSQWVLAPRPAVVPNQWRPDAAVEAELPRFMLDQPPPLPPPPVLRSSMTSMDVLPSSSVIVSPSVVQASTLSTSTVPVTLTTMTIMNSQQRLPDIEADSAGSDVLQTESVQNQYDSGGSNNDDPALLEAIEAVNLLSAKTPSSNRQMNDSSADPTNKDSTDAPWSDYTFVSDVGPSSLAEEIYPNPEQLGQVRDEYWSNTASSFVQRGRQLSGNTPPLSSTVNIQQYPMVVRPPATALFDHKPTYIPINPTDRQSRQLQAQYYADSASANVKPAEPINHSPPRLT